MKRKKRMLLLLGLLIILCGAYGGIRGWNAHLKSEKAAKKKTQTVKIINAENLAKINYTKGNKNMSFVKKNNTWKYAKDKSITLIQSSVEQIASTVSSLTTVETIEDPDALSDYGLADPVYTVKYETEAGKKGTLEIGNASGEDYYAKVQGEDTVYMIDSTLVESLQFSISSFADD